jgi:hypothetical protein
MFIRSLIHVAALCLAVECISSSHADVTDDAAKVLETANVAGGFVVHLGGSDGGFTAALQTSSSIQVQGLAFDATKLNAARKAIHAAGNDVCYFPRSCGS